MDIHRLSNDKRDATLQLNARKWALLELDEQFEALGLDVNASILNVMIKDIEEINRLLGVDDNQYEADAKADHFTENQFNG